MKSNYAEISLMNATCYINIAIPSVWHKLVLL